MIIITWGTGLFGTIYRYKGLCVAVKCFHIWRFPLIPMGAFLVVERDAGRWRGVPLPWKLPYAWHALIMAYARAVGYAVTAIAGIVGAIAILNAFQNSQWDITLLLLPLLASIGVAWLFLSREICVGNREKTLEIAEACGVKLDPAAL
jgi:hypothetical protein